MKSFCFLLAFTLAICSPAEAQISPGFGASVAIEDGTIFVGKARTSREAGTVYVYSRDDSQTWAERQRLQASDSGGQANHFGRALAASGNTLFVGAIGDDDGRGAVYVFSLQDGNWVESAKLTASDAAPNHQFGNRLAIYSERLLVGAIGPDATSGAVYVFERDAASGSWAQRSVLRGSDHGRNAEYDRRFWRMSAVPSAGFGHAIALGERTAAISAPAHSSAVLIYSHDETSDTWSVSDSLIVDGLEPRHLFGYSLLMEGDEVYVAAPRHGNDQGAVFVFGLSGDTGQWEQRGRLPDTTSTGGFRMLGLAMHMEGHDLWVTIPFLHSEGTVIHYRRSADTGQWHTAAQMPGKALLTGTVEGRRMCEALDIESNTAVCGAPATDFGEGAAFVFQVDDTTWTQEVALINEVQHIPSIVGGEVTCTDGEAERFDCGSVNLVSFLSVADLGGGRGVQVNDLWGWTDPDTGKEWALVGRMDGTSFVDVSDPYNPVYVGNLPKTEEASPSTWRDIKVYQDHAFIVADGAGNHGMQVFDLRQLRHVDQAPVTFEANAHYTNIASAHNIVINEETGFAYSAGSSSGGETCGGGLHMIDIRNPLEPAFAGCFADTETGRAGTGYSHDAQCVVYHGPDAEHQGNEICFGSNETALSIADVTDKDNPVRLSSASYLNYGYAHQGWLTEDHHFFYMNDELDELAGSVDGTRTLVWDVTDLDDPQLAMEHVSENKASDHNLYIVGDQMYQSNYQSGLYILDITDRTNPVEVGFFDTVPYGENIPSFGGSWSNYPFFKSGIIVVTSGEEGMFILKQQSVDI